MWRQIFFLVDIAFSYRVKLASSSKTSCLVSHFPFWTFYVHAGLMECFYTWVYVHGVHVVFDFHYFSPFGRWVFQCGGAFFCSRINLSGNVRW